MAHSATKATIHPACLRGFSILDCRLAAILIATPAAYLQRSTKRHKRQNDWPLDAVLAPRSHHVSLRRKLRAPFWLGHIRHGCERVLDVQVLASGRPLLCRLPHACRAPVHAEAGERAPRPARAR